LELANKLKHIVSLLKVRKLIEPKESTGNRKHGKKDIENSFKYQIKGNSFKLKSMEFIHETKYTYNQK
jgi:hypothetical protein